jgi:hypothetical protein
MKLAGAYINDDTYERLVALAAANNRTLAGQCRHLFDRALKGALVVPDAPNAAAAGRKPLLRAVARALKALEAQPQPGAAAAGTAGMAQPVAEPPRARPGIETETFPVVGGGVAAVGPVATGFAATPMPPAAARPRAACSSGRAACCASHSSGLLLNSPPTSSAQPKPIRPCLCHTPHHLRHSAPRDTHKHTQAGRTAR